MMSAPVKVEIAAPAVMFCRVSEIEMAPGDDIVVRIFPRPGDYGNNEKSTNYFGSLREFVLRVTEAGPIIYRKGTEPPKCPFCYPEDMKGGLNG
jgi:hypothetical protein